MAAASKGPVIIEGNAVQDKSADKSTTVGRDGKAVQTHPRRRQHIQGCAPPPPKTGFFMSRVCKDTDDIELQKLITEKGLNDFILTLVSNSDAKFKSNTFSCN